MGIDADYEAWASDGRVLAEIGCVLSDQSLVVRVRLPRELGQRAVEGWNREESGTRLPKPETPEQRAVRDRAAHLGLIGLAVQERGIAGGEDLIVELDASQIGAALDAAEQDGLLD